MNVFRWHFLMAAVIAIASAARADILEITAEISGEVVEIIDGVPQDRERVADFFPTTDGELPLQAAARIRPSTGELAASVAAAQFANPAEPTGANPEEFALLASAASRAAAIRHTSVATSEEVRRVRFDAADIPGALDGGLQSLRGRFFLDTVMLMTVADSNRNLDGMFVRIRVFVTITEVDQPENVQRVLDVIIEAGGDASGEVALRNVAGIPAEAVVFLSETSTNPDLGNLFTVIVAPTTLEYDYQVSIGRQYEIRANIVAESTAIEGGTSATTFAGISGDRFRDIIDDVFGSISADELVKKVADIRAVQGEMPPIVVESASSSPDSSDGWIGSSPLCGLFGVEAVAMLPLMSLMGSRRRLSRLSRRV